MNYIIYKFLKIKNKYTIKLIKRLLKIITIILMRTVISKLIKVINNFWLFII